MIGKRLSNLVVNTVEIETVYGLKYILKWLDGWIFRIAVNRSSDFLKNENLGKF